MPTYIAFLRAINLGAKRKFPKGDIVTATQAAGGSDVLTHINTGNVRLLSKRRTRAGVETDLETAYLAQTGFEVPTVAFTAAELAQIAAQARDLDASAPDLERHYIYLLKDHPEPARVAALEGKAHGSDRAFVQGRAAHVLFGPGYQAGKVDPFAVEKTLGVVATNRNRNVVCTLAEKWC